MFDKLFVIKKTNCIFAYKHKIRIMRFTLIFALIFITQNIFSQPFANKVYKNNIRTIQCYKTGWPSSHPIIELNSNQSITLEFDEITSDTKNYSYSIEHCTKDWKSSNLMDTQFTQGINNNQISEYEYSFNTTVSYVHYSLQIPNENIDLTLSGNYIIKVFEDFDDDSPIFTQRFMVKEQLVNIIPDVKFTMNSSMREATQEIDLTITHPSFKISDPRSQVSVNIIQNQRYDNAIYNLSPQFINGDKLIYNYNKKSIFEGGNEFRWLDLRSIRVLREGIKDITFHSPYYHIDIIPNNYDPKSSYFFKNDFNGKYVIDAETVNNPNTESEYLLVHFRLPYPKKITEGEVYVLGGLTDWKLNKKSIMKYNNVTKEYECTLLLKQGFYNYQYIFKPNNSTKANVNIFEGSHGQTENDYLIFVYYKGFSDFYDRLIGVQNVNSMQQHHQKH